MVDWFASKIGLLIFVVVAASALFAFTGMQLGIYSNALNVQTANDLATLADNLCLNCSVNYTFQTFTFDLKVYEHNLTFNNITRQFSSEAVRAVLKKKTVIINNTLGKVYFG